MFNDYSTLMFAVVLVMAWMAVGTAFWAHLTTYATTDEEHLMVVGAAGASPWMVVGKLLMIAAWPFWVILPAIVKVGMSLFRPQAPEVI